MWLYTWDSEFTRNENQRSRVDVQIFSSTTTINIHPCKIHFSLCFSIILFFSLLSSPGRLLPVLFYSRLLSRIVISVTDDVPLPPSSPASSPHQPLGLIHPASSVTLVPKSRQPDLSRPLSGDSRPAAVPRGSTLLLLSSEYYCSNNP